MKIKSVINKAIGKLGYSIVSLKELKKLQKKRKQERFSLNTGERQTATDLEGIRKDHLVRYECVVDFLKKNYEDTSALLGGDIFCGNGYGSHIISKETKCFTLGIDASREAIELADKHYANEKMLFSVKRFPFNLPMNLFDFIVSFETIEHLFEDKELIKEFSSGLKSGGFLFLSAPNEDVCSFEKNNYEFHVKHYTFDDILGLLSINDFELITWFGNGAFNFEDGKLLDLRNESQMGMKENEFDSHLTYIFKKI